MTLLTEEFHVYLLLTHGGDPEPHLEKASDEYNRWRMKVQDTIEEHIGGKATKEFGQYFAWLQKNGLAYKRFDYQENTRVTE